MVIVAGSRLNIARAVSVPGPSERCAIGISQLVEKTLSRAARTGLLGRVDEHAAVEHQRPRAALGHEHVVRRGRRLGSGASAFVIDDLLNECGGRSHPHRHLLLRHALFGHVLFGHSRHRHAGVGLCGSLLHSRHGRHLQADAGAGNVAGAFVTFAGECGGREKDAARRAMILCCAD